MPLRDHILGATDEAERRARRDLDNVRMVGCVGHHENPAAVLRRCAADRRVLERHSGMHPCVGGVLYVDLSCPDAEDLADRWGVEP